MENFETLDVVQEGNDGLYRGPGFDENGDIALEVLAQDEADIGAEGLEEGTTVLN